MVSPNTRRVFLRSSLGISGALLLGCGEEEPDLAPGACDDPFAGGVLQNQETFLGEGDTVFHTVLGEGLDGRLITDLSLLQPESLNTETSQFFLRTLKPDLLDDSIPWELTLQGSSGEPQTMQLTELLALERPMGIHVLECSGNPKSRAFGLLSSADWHGVPVVELLDRIDESDPALRVRVTGFDEHSQPSAGGHSTPGASWVFSRDDLERAGAFLATRINGEPLPGDRGAPVRLLVPGWYGCTCIKWVNRIELVPDDVAATSQMKEFASRTHQLGVPELARDYLPATVDHAAMPVRVERWSVNVPVLHRIVGILWGGEKPTNALEIRVGDESWQPVAQCSGQSAPGAWVLWTHPYRVTQPGPKAIRLRIADASVMQRRLDAGYYERVVQMSLA